MLISNNKLLSMLQKKKIVFNNNKIFQNTVENYPTFPEVLKILKSIKPNSARQCLFLTNRKLGCSVVNDDMILISYTNLCRRTKEKKYIIQNFILLSVPLENGKWDAISKFWTVGDEEKFNFADDLSSKAEISTRKTLAAIKRCSMMNDVSQIENYLDATFGSPY